MYFSNIDLLSGYFQMALEEERQNVTAFMTPLGLYKRKRLPMGLASAPEAFLNRMEFFCWSLLRSSSSLSRRRYRFRKKFRRTS